MENEINYLAKVSFTNPSGEQEVTILAQRNEDGTIGLVSYANELVNNRDQSQFDLENDDVFIALYQKFIDFVENDVKEEGV